MTKKNISLNIRAMNVLHRALNENNYVKISIYSNAKDILNILDSIYLTNLSGEFVDGVYRENKEVLKDSSHVSRGESLNSYTCFMAKEE